MTEKEKNEILGAIMASYFGLKRNELARALENLYTKQKTLLMTNEQNKHIIYELKLKLKRKNKKIKKLKLKKQSNHQETYDIVL